MNFIKRIKEFKWGYVLISIITAVVGVCFIAFGNESLEALAITMGVIIISAAILLAVFTMASKKRGFSYGVKIVLAVIMLISGIVTVISKEAAINVIIGIFGLIIIMDGTFKFNTTAMSKRFELWAWIVLLVLSVLLIGGGYTIVRYLNIEQKATVYLLGVLLIIDSVANFLSAFYIGAYERRSENQIRSEIYCELASEKENEEEEEQNSTENFS